MSDVRTLATEAGEAVRALNHATIGNGGEIPAADVAAVVAELGVMVGRLPQLVAQIGQHLRALDAGGLVRLDGDGAERFTSTTAAVVAADALLAQAAAGAEVLGQVLVEVHEITASMGGPIR